MNPTTAKQRFVSQLVHGVIANSGKSLEQVADACGLSPHVLARYRKTNDHLRFPMDCLGELTEITQNRAVIHWLANECGGLFVLYPDVTELASLMSEHYPKLFRECGALLTAFADAISPAGDGGAAITPAERAVLYTHLDTQEEMIHQVRLFLNSLDEHEDDDGDLS